MLSMVCGCSIVAVQGSPKPLAGVRFSPPVQNTLDKPKYFEIFRFDLTYSTKCAIFYCSKETEFKVRRFAMDCPFCNIEKEMVLFETKHALVIVNLFPAVRGHLLVVPKVHVASIDLLEERYCSEIAICAKKAVSIIKENLLPDGVNIFTADGAIAGQTILHHHWHIVPRINEDRFENFKRPPGERVSITEEDRIFLKNIFNR